MEGRSEAAAWSSPGPAVLTAVASGVRKLGQQSIFHFLRTQDTRLDPRLSDETKKIREVINLKGGSFLILLEGMRRSEKMLSNFFEIFFFHKIFCLIQNFLTLSVYCIRAFSPNHS